jgi:RNA polymerase ECF-type sigma factor
LPPQCREIFFRSKIEGKKHAEIAQELNISINTIESQMSIAYRKLRKSLERFLLILLFFVLHF